MNIFLDKLLFSYQKDFNFYIMFKKTLIFLSIHTNIFYANNVLNTRVTNQTFIHIKHKKHIFFKTFVAFERQTNHISYKITSIL